ncbi:sugar-binding transcriptional regulator [Cellulomonas denverensis]|uniref:Transcriptional regulator n=1 Tax=Cellulomonas denverensis TaxID=264297 RepID=A0A7X6KRV4_9CELL|nr:sugar-binding domain-containing protein [Cellulomonas denverensis]NKY21096.1 transcriptional regulator [Cellulomonas denverensis]GIG26043.1 transcriptional regulator [Cellulomonas denverensis]
MDLRPLKDAERLRLADVAELYWVHGVKVEEIGERLHLSRSTISRMLAKARQHGVIEFTVHRRVDRTAQLGPLLAARYGLAATVVPVSEDAAPGALLDTVAVRAAEQLTHHIGSDMVVSVAWGSTVEAISLHLTGRPTHGTRIVQLYGSVNVFSTGAGYAGQILERFGRAFGAAVHHFPTPAFFDSPHTRAAMWQERSAQRILRLRARSDVLISSVGTLTSEYHGHLLRSGYLTSQEITGLLHQGVVGSLGAMFFRADGSTTGIGINDRSTGMPPAEIREIPTRFVVAADPAKAEALRAAIRAGLVSALVLDSRTAEALLRLEDDPG